MPLKQPPEHEAHDILCGAVKGAAIIGIIMAAAVILLGLLGFI